jgi:hypothetical protein
MSRCNRGSKRGGHPEQGVRGFGGRSPGLAATLPSAPRWCSPRPTSHTPGHTTSTLQSPTCCSSGDASTQTDLERVNGVVGSHLETLSGSASCECAAARSHPLTRKHQPSNWLRETAGSSFAAVGRDPFVVGHGFEPGIGHDTHQTTGVAGGSHRRYGGPECGAGGPEFHRGTARSGRARRDRCHRRWRDRTRGGERDASVVFDPAAECGGIRD